MLHVIGEVTLGTTGSPLERHFVVHARDFLRRQLGVQKIQVRSWSSLPEVELSLHDWASPRMADVSGFDRLFDQLERDGDFKLYVRCRDWHKGRYAALQLLTRYQRFFAPEPRLQLESMQDAAQALRALLSATEDRARLARSLDRARWVTRLDSFATRPVQLAALFAEAGGEDDALASARALCRSLEHSGIPQGELFRAAELIINGHAPDGDADRALLHDAESLAFFNVESFRYLRSFGAEATRLEARRRLATISSDALLLVQTTKQPSVIQDYLHQAPAQSPPRAEPFGAPLLAW